MNRAALAFVSLATVLMTAAPPSFAATNTSTTTRPGIAVFSAIGGVGAVDRRELAAVTEAFAPQAERTFFDRRWRVWGHEVTVAALCRSEECFVRQARALGATHWLAIELSRTSDSSCRIIARLGRVSPAPAASTAPSVEAESSELSVCSADRLLAAATMAGRTISDGPRWRPAPVWTNTKLEPPDLSIPDIRPALPYAVSSTATARPVPLRRALVVYRAVHLAILNDPEDPSRRYLIRGQRLITECELRRFVQVPPEVYRPAPPCDDGNGQPSCPAVEPVRVFVEPPPPRIAAYCAQNAWEWAWLGPPVGALAMFGAFEPARQGRLEGVAFFGLGLIGAVTTAVLAWTLDKDAPDPRDGLADTPSSHATLQALIGEHNRGLREVLGLSVADVRVAGLSP